MKWVLSNQCKAEARSERDLHVAAACNAAYAMPLATMLASLTASLDPTRKVTLHILNRDLGDALKSKVEATVGEARASFHWIDIKEKRFAFLATTIRGFDTVSLETYYRLLLPEVLPPDLDKVIYLDCDLVVCRDLGEVWDLDISGVSLYACPELIADAAVAAAPQGIRRYRELGLAGDQKLFNAGVLLINLKYWRENQVFLRALVYVREMGQDLRWHDQEALNVVLAGSWQTLDPRWNVTMHVFSADPQSARTARLIDHPGIVHYNSAIKPWHPDFALGFREPFFQYLDMTPWSGWRPGPPRTRGKRAWASLRRALQKRQHALKRYATHLCASASQWRRKKRPLPRLLGGRPPAEPGAELRAFVAARSGPKLESFLDRLREAAVDRVFVVLKDADTGTAAALQSRHEALHIFLASDPTAPDDSLLRDLLDRYGSGHWCSLLDLDEKLEPPLGEKLSLKNLCQSLEDKGFDALLCHVVETASEGDESIHDDSLVEIATVVRDPMSNRLFPASLLVAPTDVDLADSIGCRSKVALFKYRHDRGIAEKFRAVQSDRLADFRGRLLRLRDQS